MEKFLYQIFLDIPVKDQHTNSLQIKDIHPDKKIAGF
jgi:hypothetical protein